MVDLIGCTETSLSALAPSSLLRYPFVDGLNVASSRMKPPSQPARKNSRPRSGTSRTRRCFLLNEIFALRDQPCGLPRRKRMLSMLSLASEIASAFRVASVSRADPVQIGRSVRVG
jgi:hypothetical protein